VEISIYISWIFLPAALRMISVLLFRWRGVAGLLLGSLMVTLNQIGPNSIHTWVFPLLSSLSPMLAMLLGVGLMKVHADLEGLRAWQLLVFSSLGALINALTHNLYFQYSGIAASWTNGFTPMFVGDLAGTLMMLFGASFILRFLHRQAIR
jgi:hypothetical protein